MENETLKEICKRCQTRFLYFYIKHVLLLKLILLGIFTLFSIIGFFIEPPAINNLSWLFTAAIYVYLIFNWVITFIAQKNVLQRTIKGYKLLLIHLCTQAVVCFFVGLSVSVFLLIACLSIGLFIYCKKRKYLLVSSGSYGDPSPAAPTGQNEI